MICINKFNIKINNKLYKLLVTFHFDEIHTVYSYSILLGIPYISIFKLVVTILNDSHKTINCFDI